MACNRFCRHTDNGYLLGHIPNNHRACTNDRVDTNFAHAGHDSGANADKRGACQVNTGANIDARGHKDAMLQAGMVRDLCAHADDAIIANCDERHEQHTGKNGGSLPDQRAFGNER